MNSRNGFTKTDILIVSGCMVFLMATLGAVGSAGRQRAQESVCLSNLNHWGSAFQMWLNDHNGTFPDGHDKWFHSLGAYYGWKPENAGIDPSKKHELRRQYKIRMCPAAARFSDEGASPMFSAWEAGLTYSGYSDPENVWDNFYWDGSYGTNSWVYNAANTVLIGGTPVQVTWKNANVKSANQIPMLLDSASFGGRPVDTDNPPETPGDVVNYSNDFMKTFMIDRHNGSVNTVFMDFSARSVGLKELYTLKWHRLFNTCGRWTPCGNTGGGKGGSGPTKIPWPDWLTKYRDY